MLIVTLFAILYYLQAKKPPKLFVRNFISEVCSETNTLETKEKCDTHQKTDKHYFCLFYEQVHLTDFNFKVNPIIQLNKQSFTWGIL